MTTTQLHVSASIGAEIALLLRRAIGEHPPCGIRLPGATAVGHEPHRIGAYLLGLGYITPNQLVRALTIQRQHRLQGSAWAIGEILVQREIIPAQVLVATLLVQSMDRMLDPYSQAHWRLGEHLISLGIVTPLQLAPVLQLQVWLRLRNIQIWLGDLLVEQGIIDKTSLMRVLRDQRIERGQPLLMTRTLEVATVKV